LHQGRCKGREVETQQLVLQQKQHKKLELRKCRFKAGQVYAGCRCGAGSPERRDATAAIQSRPENGEKFYKIDKKELGRKETLVLASCYVYNNSTAANQSNKR